MLSKYEFSANENSIFKDFSLVDIFQWLRERDGSRLVHVRLSDGQHLSLTYSLLISRKRGERGLPQDLKIDPVIEREARVEVKDFTEIYLKLK